MTKVSVIMSTYNENENEIYSAVKSILNQTFSDFEFIIINDNPLSKKLEKFLYEISKLDQRIKIVNNTQNMGLAKSLNVGIKNATGKYIARMDADDISLKDRLFEEVSFLDNNPDIDMVSANCDYIDINDNIIGKKSAIPTTFSKIKKILPIGSDIIHPTVLIRKKIIEELHGYRNFPTAEDYDLWLRMLSTGYKIASIDKILLHYRIREDSMTSNTFLLVLVENYQRNLYKERLKNKNDHFSPEDLEIYLRQNNYYNDKYRKKYQHYDAEFENSIELLKSKNVLLATNKFLKSMLGTKLNRKRIFNFIKYECISLIIN